MNIGFIGCGNMASAIIKGIKSNNDLNQNIYVYDIYPPAIERCVNNFDCISCNDENNVVLSSDIVFLAVKPNILSSVIEKISADVMEKQPLIISIAAGKSIDFIADCFNCDCPIVRVMPNINAQVGEAISAYCHNSFVNENDLLTVEALLSCTGKVLYLDEDFFPLFGVIGGCSPAFVYMFIDSLARAAVKNGMKKADALKISAQAVYGSAKMILESDKHPWELVDNVCSPGGTTIEGVTSLQADGFESAIQNAVDSALNKDKRL